MLENLTMISQKESVIDVAFDLFSSGDTPLVFDNSGESLKKISLNPNLPTKKDLSNTYGDWNNLVKNQKTGKFCCLAHLMYVARRYHREITLSSIPDSFVFKYEPISSNKFWEVDSITIRNIADMHATQILCMLGEHRENIKLPDSMGKTLILNNKLTTRQSLNQIAKEKLAFFKEPNEWTVFLEMLIDFTSDSSSSFSSSKPKLVPQNEPSVIEVTV